MKFPNDKAGLYLEHNPHKTVYLSVAEYLDEVRFRNMDPGDKAECIRTDELWTLQWYPETPVRCVVVAGPTLERVLELAKE